MAVSTTVLRVGPGKDFVVTPFIENLCQRCLVYLELGYPVHLIGPAGIGKTTLAMHLAGFFDRPLTMIHGDEEFGTSDLVGSDRGVVSKRTVDNYIHSVSKTEESVARIWVDQRLTTACREGHTLIYDEFSRSHAEANNILLPVLEERLLVLPVEGQSGERYIPVHPEFRAIFTSNPDEYAGVYTPQSALLDRMITLKLENIDMQTEIAISAAKSGLPPAEVKKVVEVVRAVREHANGALHPPTIRASIMISRILHHRQGKVHLDDEIFIETCRDILAAGSDSDGQIQQILKRIENLRKV